MCPGLVVGGVGGGGGGGLVGAGNGGAWVDEGCDVLCEVADFVEVAAAFYRAGPAVESAGEADSQVVGDGGIAAVDRGGGANVDGAGACLQDEVTEGVVVGSANMWAGDGVGTGDDDVSGGGGELECLVFFVEFEAAVGVVGFGDTGTAGDCECKADAW